MGMAIVFDEASELVPPPPGDYGMCGAAAELGNIATSFKEKVVVQENSDQGGPNSRHELQHGATYQVLVAFLVLVSVVASGAALGLLLMWRRSKHGTFERINPHSQHISETDNPLGELSAHCRVGAACLRDSGSSNFTELAVDELEEIDFNQHHQYMP